MTERASMAGDEERPAAVDWQYWARMPGWRASEAAALLLELDPDCAKSKSPEVPPTQLLTEYARLRRLLRRAETMGDLKCPTRPRDLLEWAKANEVSIPQSLAEAVSGNQRLRDWKKRALTYRRRLRKFEATSKNAEDLPAKSLKSLYTILLAIAEEKYLYNPNKNNSAAKNIAGTLAKREFFEPKEETIRRWLQKAHEAVRL